MKTILLVKTSSLGDVIHNLPVASDIQAAIPDNHIDWVVEESFADVPRLHPAVGRVLPVALRRWRRNPLSNATRKEIGRFFHELRSCRYDAVIDTQGLLKSALIACSARGPSYGLDWKSAREPLMMFYTKTFAVSWALHAVDRNRTLAGRALGYDIPNGVKYGVHAPAGDFGWLPSGPYAVLLHATSQKRKLWRESDWIELGILLAACAWRSVLPWHSPHERERSERLARSIPAAVVPPALVLADTARLIAGAGVAIGVDTGLTHLAAAFGLPTAGIYCATDPATTGLYGSARAVNVGRAGTPPSPQEILKAIERVGARPEDD
jgi:lipopolysaccharide heptosyltransferase I